MPDDHSTRSGSELVYDALVDAGVSVLVGLPGTQTLPLDRTVAQHDDIEYVMARHETAVPHVAWGYYETSGEVAATLTVPGPGDTNAAHGLKNAYDDNVPIIHVSADSTPEEFGKHPIHEIDPETFDNVVKENVTVEDPARLREHVEWGIEVALTPPYGPVRLGIPSEFLSQSVSSPPVSVTPERRKYGTKAACAEAADQLAAAERPALYVGGGTRRSPEGPAAARELAELLNAPVAVSVKGKGAFPEDDPRYLGTTGGDFPAGARAVLDDADVVLALGCNFDGPNTANWSIPMGDVLVQIDLDPGEIGVAYDADVGVVGDVSAACESITKQLRERDRATTWKGDQLATAVRQEYNERLRSRGLLGDGPPLSTPTVMRTVREALPSETIVTTDIGAHRVWSRNTFPVTERERYVTAGSWAGMGVGLPSAIGAKLAYPDCPVVTLSGDGSLLMCTQELHTAAERDLNITVVLFNDADYGAISKSEKISNEVEGRRFSWSSPDWLTVVEGFGCEGRRAETRDEVADAIRWAVDAEVPTVVDIDIDGEEPTPYEVADYETAIDPSTY